MMHNAWEVEVQSARMTVYPKQRADRRSETPELLAGYLRRIARGRLLTHEEEIELGKKARAGDGHARKKLVETNLRLAVSVAKKYRATGCPSRTSFRRATEG